MIHYTWTYCVPDQRMVLELTFIIIIGKTYGEISEETKQENIRILSRARMITYDYSGREDERHNMIRDNIQT